MRTKEEIIKQYNQYKSLKKDESFAHYYPSEAIALKVLEWVLNGDTQ